jgi:hypothetical protein
MQLLTDGCVHLLYNNSSWKFYQFAARQLLSRQPCSTVRKRQAVRPVHHVQYHTCRVTLLLPARWAAVFGQPSSLRPHWWDTRGMCTCMVILAHNYSRLARQSRCLAPSHNAAALHVQENIYKTELTFVYNASLAPNLVENDKSKNKLSTPRYHCIV